MDMVKVIVRSFIKMLYGSYGIGSFSGSLKLFHK